MFAKDQYLKAYAAGAKDMCPLLLRTQKLMNNTPLLERCKNALKRYYAKSPSATIMGQALIKDLEAAIADQAKPQEPVGYLAFRNGAPAWDEDCVCQDAVYPIDGSDDRVSVAIYTYHDGELWKPPLGKPQEPVAYRLPNPDIDGNFIGQHCYYDLTELKSIPDVLEPLYTHPQEREPMSEEELETLRLRAALYEHIRKFSVPKFREIFKRNIQGEGSFDDLVYADMQANKEVGAKA